MRLEQEVEGILRLEEDASEAQTERKKRIETLRENILNGETTGDSIRDFVIVSDEILSEEAEQPYRKLEEMLKGKEGEQVLVVNEEIESGGRSGCFGSHSYTNVDSTLRLGILTSEIEFEIGDGKTDFSLLSINTSLHGSRIILPTEKYVVKREGGLSPKKWELVEGNIEISDLEFYGFDIDGKKTEPHGIMMRGGPESGSCRHYNRLLIKVGEDVPEYFRENGLWKGIDTSYVKTLKSLGIENQAPNDFVIGYNEEIGEAKGDIIKSLIGLLEQQDLSKSRIRSIYDIAERGGVVSEGGAITPIESKDDAFWVSFRDKENLRETNREIKNRLEAAVELGMHEEDLLVDGKIPGGSLDVKVFVRTLCGIYEVPYSKN